MNTIDKRLARLEAKAAAERATHPPRRKPRKSNDRWHRVRKDAQWRREFFGEHAERISRSIINARAYQRKKLRESVA